MKISNIKFITAKHITGEGKQIPLINFFSVNQRKVCNYEYTGITFPKNM